MYLKLYTIITVLIILLFGFKIVVIADELHDTKIRLTNITIQKNELETGKNLYRTLFQLMYIHNSFNDENKKKLNFLKEYINQINPNIYSKVDINDLSKSILKACEEYGFDWITIVALIKVESDFDPFAISSKSARGLCQIIYKYWKKYIPKEERNNPNILFDPYINVIVAGKILQELNSKFNTQREVFNYYSGGHYKYYQKIKQTKISIQDSFNKFKNKGEKNIWRMTNF